jgi:hypothetical protein
MSFLSGLKVFGHGIEKVFGWFGGPKGQVVLAAGEGVAEALGVPVPIINLINQWIAKIFNVESLAVAANQAKGTGADKAALVLQTITPAVIQYAVDAGLPAPTAANIEKANDALVAFINALTQPAPAA